MKPFLVYTGLRLMLFVTSLVVIGGVVVLVARLSGREVGSGTVFVAVAAAAVVSAIGSWKLLRTQREALAQVVEGRAARASDALERSRSKEDID
ncbi:DUF4229 domain-containing protein [Nocardioidaceae bacterium]|nr:DUF4229 domain-containing protein [Nocardioidaceae bacterium]